MDTALQNKEQLSGGGWEKKRSAWREPWRMGVRLGGVSLLAVKEELDTESDYGHFSSR